MLIEPEAQDPALRRVGSFLGEDTTFDLGEGGSRDELVGHGDGRCPGFDNVVRTPRWCPARTSQLGCAGGKPQPLGLELDVGALVCAEQVDDRGRFTL